jgi:hypothetical protein
MVERHLRVNLLCLAGALIILVSLALPWGIETTGYIGSEIGYRYPIQLTDPINFMGDERLTSIAVIVVLGGVISIFTPLGGIIQLLGVVSYFRHMAPSVGTLPGPAYFIWSRFSFASGFYLAVFATAVTLLSVLVPVGVRYRHVYHQFSERKLSLLQRMVVWGLD